MREEGRKGGREGERGGGGRRGRKGGMKGGEAFQFCSEAALKMHVEKMFRRSASFLKICTACVSYTHMNAYLLHIIYMYTV